MPQPLMLARGEGITSNWVKRAFEMPRDTRADIDRGCYNGMDVNTHTTANPWPIRTAATTQVPILVDVLPGSACPEQISRPVWLGAWESYGTAAPESTTPRSNGPAHYAQARTSLASVPGSGWHTHWLNHSMATMATRPDSATAASRLASSNEQRSTCGDSWPPTAPLSLNIVHRQSKSPRGPHPPTPSFASSPSATPDEERMRGPDALQNRRCLRISLELTRPALGVRSVPIKS
ncbi:hypothetical protein G7Z17_g9573 [Cylindrodendrum hubeiense]|uniref:Uncharacterized protein n=1 Tax=Cylindrodendrum hubeiense TaxID=595255 RepID=A0A9P5H061_9HYPO|nr:hypothetical protein G7Z17_g9573 [Cylindrodendrum hubeiense]